MKKILVILLFIASYSISQAQIKMPKIDTSTAASALNDFVKPPNIGDIGKTSTGITDMLISKLGLPASQKTDLTSTISGFLGQKKGILGQASSDPASYLSKFSLLQQGLFSKLKGIMGASAFTKMLGLKPSSKNAAGDLSLIHI